MNPNHSRSSLRWLISMVVILCVLSVPVLAGGADDPGGQPEPPPTTVESAGLTPTIPVSWVLLILGSAMGPVLLALWRR